MEDAGEEAAPGGAEEVWASGWYPGGSGAGKAGIPKGERINAEYKRLRPELWKIPIFWKRKRRQNMSEKVLLRRVWDEIQKDTGKLMVHEGLS